MVRVRYGAGGVEYIEKDPIEKEQEEFIKLSVNSDYSNNSLNSLLKKISLSLDNFDENSCHKII